MYHKESGLKAFNEVLTGSIELFTVETDYESLIIIMRVAAIIDTLSDAGCFFATIRAP